MLPTPPLPESRPVLELVEVTSKAARRTSRPHRELLEDIVTLVHVVSELERLCDELEVFRAAPVEPDAAHTASDLIASVRQLADELERASARIASKVELPSTLIAEIADIVQRLRELGCVVAIRVNEAVLGRVQPVDYERDSGIDAGDYLRALRTGEHGPWDASS